MGKQKQQSPLSNAASGSAGLAMSDDGEIAAFLGAIADTPKTGTGRLIFSLDATASREPSWDQACHLQSEMFTQAAQMGGLWVQLVYFRGFHEFKTSQWVNRTESLAPYMTHVSCAGGHTQIARLLDHTLRETQKQPVAALVYIGDCCEESVDDICQKAGQLGMLNVPAFVFQEGYDKVANHLFPEIARLSGGAYCRFDTTSPDRLRDLLKAVATYASGGQKALSMIDHSGAASEIITQLRLTKRQE